MTGGFMQLPCHNRVRLNLAGRIGDHLDGTPCQVFAESMKVQVNEGILYPDVMVTCGKGVAGDEKIITGSKLVSLAGLRSFDKALDPEHWARYVAQFSGQSAVVAQEIA
jgi:hypothetical protein